MREPTRYALVLGMSDYTKSGTLGNLPEACNEAKLFRKSLLGINFDSKNIFPELKDGDENSLCDLKYTEFSNAIDAFIKLLLDKQNQGENPYGVIYFSGHGAQHGADQYLFPVDADVNLDMEYARLVQTAGAQHPYPVFSGQAVDISQKVSVINGLGGIALLVLIDACRNDDLIDSFKAKLNADNTLNFTQKQGISIDYISSAQNEWSDAYEDVLMLMSTARHTTAGGAPAGATTDFSTRIRKFLDGNIHLSDEPIVFANAFRSDALAGQRAVDPDKRQIPEIVGGIAPKPVFCLKGCPQPLSNFSSETSAIIFSGAAPTQGAFLMERKPKAIPATYYLPAPETWADGLQRVALRHVRARPAVAHPAVAHAPAPSAKGMKIDVFYCTGDPERQAEAARYAHKLGDSASSLPGDLSLSLVRLRSLDIIDNLKHGLKKNDNSVWVDKGDLKEKAWGDYLTTVENLDVRVTGVATPNYISVFFCKGVDLKAVPAIYTQVPVENDVPPVAAVINQIQTEHPDFYFVSKIQPITEIAGVTPPKKTEVKYILDSQAGSAQQIASWLQSHLNTDVVVKQIKVHAPIKSTAPAMEIWVGTDDIQRFPPVAPPDSPVN